MQLCFEGVEILLEKGVVRRGGVEIELTRREVALLRYLGERSPSVVPRQHILQDVWGWKPWLHTRGIDMAIARLRKKVELDPTSPRVITTAPGVGYALARDVVRTFRRVA